MFTNYLKIAWRNLLKSKFYSVINILGLAAGMAVAMLIAFWIWDEVTYDRYHTNHETLAQVMTTFIDNDGKKRNGLGGLYAYWERARQQVWQSF